MHAIVIGGGVSGLAAAHRLTEEGVRVTLLEASNRLGGKLLSGELAGVRTDLGAESMLARRPEGVDLARAVGLGDALQPPAVATASIWTRDALRPMPRGHLMGIPARAEDLAGVLSDEGVGRARRDADLPGPLLPDEGDDGNAGNHDDHGTAGDIAIGRLVADRMGDEVVDRLVEPLLGGVYAGDARAISLRAALPGLYEAARTAPTLADAVRAAMAAGAPRPAGTPPPAPFTGLDGGMGTLPGAIADACRAAGAEIRTDAPVRSLRRMPTGWVVTVGPDADTAEELAADAVVLAVPAGPAARLLADHAPAAARELDGIGYASMALITVALRRSDLDRPLPGSGFLVPAVDGRFIKASTFSSGKWEWAGRDPELYLLRASVGRHGDPTAVAMDDADLVKGALADLREAVGLTAAPVASVVTRWIDGLPQYTPGHAERIGRVRRAVAVLPGLRVCGAAHDGVGIPACIADARAAVADLRRAVPAHPTDLRPRPGRPTPNDTGE
ncbi:protoporphyrinogen oxidase [Streptomyces sp. ST2-7A]|uniref:protoporphyrinogen oxidase n=1 Tax=Streptomyces sp. ST2-7A TaxID=2907214 RepID=UPI001F364499|nr:protoporphyrinogen oxidase [Streptomyces sp. ST2-7A]MCE7083510.1 protoporphyrinogen oxidase [Streptomyces sp. ST2-7A]